MAVNTDNIESLFYIADGYTQWSSYLSCSCSKSSSKMSISSSISDSVLIFASCKKKP